MSIRTTLKTMTKGAIGMAGGLALAFAITGGIPTKAMAQIAPDQAVQGDGPGLWVIKDEDSTIYLFGTVHMLRPTTSWKSPAVVNAFNSADELYLEITDPNDQAAVLPLIQQYGLSPDRPLSSLLTAEELATFDEAAKSMGASAAQFDIFRPWLASITLAVTPMVKAGYDPTSGVDGILRQAALDASKPIKGLETMQEQISMLATLPEDQQVDMLRESIRTYQEAATMLDGIVGAWEKGDVEAINTLMIIDMKNESPDLYEAILTKRNVNWVNQIQTLLQGSGTTFIAVGAAHLAGADSVQALLAQRGVTSERVTH